MSALVDLLKQYNKTGQMTQSATPTGPAPSPSPTVVGPAPTPPAPATAPAPTGGIVSAAMQDIQQSYANLAKVNDPAAVQKYLATTPYSAEQLSQATGYKLNDMQAALSAARASQPAAQQWSPATQTQQLGGVTQMRGGDPGVSGGYNPQTAYEASKLTGFRGSFEDWQAQQSVQRATAQSQMAANPNVVVGGYTPETQATAFVKSGGIVGSQTPAQTGSKSAISGFIKSLDWTPQNEGSSVTSVYNEALRNGWTAKQVGDAMGFSEQQILEAYKKYGLGQTGSANGSQSGGTGFNKWEVTPPQTVQQQAAGIVAADGSLMQQARGRAMQQMNERGLVNSTLAIQAGQDAVLDRAIQIAQQDAATNAEAAKFNAGQSNAWTLAQQELAEKASQFTRELASKYDLAKFDQESRKALAATEREYQQQLATDQAFQEQYQMYVDAVFKIDTDPELSAEAKSARKQEQLQLLRNYANIRGLNLDQYLTFNTPATTSPTTAPAAATGLVSQADGP